MTDFHFLRPWWLIALLPLAAVVWQWFRRQDSAGDWSRVCDAALLPHVLIGHGRSTPMRRGVLLFTFGGVLSVLALAGPAWERLPAPAFRNDEALVIALDLSRTMDAADIKPSRLERARFKIADILKQRKDGLTALVVYSGDAFTVTPLTDDIETIKAHLSALTSDLMPIQGSRADLALGLAERLLRQTGLTRGDVLLISSGVNLTHGSPATKQLRAHGYRVSVLGAGGDDGAPIPLPQGGFLQDSKGNIVISKLAIPALQQLAAEGGGLYRTITTDSTDLSALLEFFDRPVKAQSAGAETQIKIEQWLDRGPWLLLGLLPIAALAFRRGYLAACLILLAPAPDSAYALDWQGLWQTRDQQAQRAFESGQPARAAEAFQDPDWKAAAQYRAERYEDAAKTLQGLESVEAHYNRGNALAKMGRYPEAIAAYEKALALDPKHEDARYNKELVEKALKEQEKQEQQEQQEQQKQEQQQQQDRKNQQHADKESSRDRLSHQQQQQSRQDGEQQTPAQQAEQSEQGSEDGGQDDQGAQDQAQSNQEREKPAKPSAMDPQQAQTTSDAEQPKDGQRPTAGAETEKHANEDQQASEQWLRRIPDDPGGLLKRKFYYQYQQRQEQGGRAKP